MANYSDKRCNGCPYHNQKHLIGSNAQYVTNRPNPPLEMEDNGSDILLIFQSPGENEWIYGNPLLALTKVGGTAGARVKQSWDRVGKERKDFNITNIVQCYQGKSPKNNRDNKLDKISKCKCSLFLEADILKNKYKKIIVFGKQAENAVKPYIIKHNLSGITEYKRHPTGGLKNTDLDNLW